MGSNIRRKEILSKTEQYIKQYFKDEGSGHDWWHIYRVQQSALSICKQEGGDEFIVEMAALLHDLDDWKLNKEANKSKAKEWLLQSNTEESEMDFILEVIDEVSFKGAGVETKATTIEAQIVQDADRLDAIGAIGIARTFAYGGNKNRLLYDPDIKPTLHQNFEAYKNNTAPTINHFYEKLLLLKNLMNTETAKSLAASRHAYMENFLSQFYREWEGQA